MADFQFSSAALRVDQPPPTPSNDRLQQVRVLDATGTVRDVDQLLAWLGGGAASTPEFRAACCMALTKIARRKDFFGEGGRPLVRTRQVLSNLIRCDSDALVQQSAAEASTAVDDATAFLPVWSVASAPAEVIAATSPPPSASVAAAPGGAPTEPTKRKPLHQQPAEWAAVLAAAESGSNVVGGSDGAAPLAAPPAKRSRSAPSSELGVKPVDDELYHALVAVRHRLADGKPAYTVASNKELAAIASRRPLSRFKLLQINGIGKQKAEMYGDAFIQCVAEHPRLHGETSDGAAADGELPAASPTVEAEATAVPTPLSDEQQYATRLVMEGESIFLTGGAGTGKSFTLKHIIETLQKMCAPSRLPGSGDPCSAPPSSQPMHC